MEVFHDSTWGGTQRIRVPESSPGPKLITGEAKSQNESKPKEPMPDWLMSAELMSVFIEAKQRGSASRMLALAREQTNGNPVLNAAISEKAARSYARIENYGKAIVYLREALQYLEEAPWTDEREALSADYQRLIEEIDKRPDFNWPADIMPR